MGESASLETALDILRMESELSDNLFTAGSRSSPPVVQDDCRAHLDFACSELAGDTEQDCDKLQEADPEHIITSVHKVDIVISGDADTFVEPPKTEILHETDVPAITLSYLTLEYGCNSESKPELYKRRGQGSNNSLILVSL